MFEWLGDLVAFQILRLTPESQLGAAVQFFVMDVAKIFLLLVAVIFLEFARPPGGSCQRDDAEIDALRALDAWIWARHACVEDQSTG